MFLQFLRAHNPALVDYGMFLLEQGLIEPDTYLLDLDGIEANAGRLGDLARRRGLTLYCMAKQIGRNPEAARRVLGAGGFAGMVAVDFREARGLHAAGLPVRHLGHLCQVPRHGWDAALDMAPEAVTLYSVEKGRELSAAASGRGMVQGVLLRVRDRGDIFYPGQEGGFPLDTLGETMDTLGGLPGIRIAGLTSFPCFLYQEDQGRALPTPNARTLGRGAAVFRERGLPCSQINMPSCNSPATIPLAAELGATHLEPGHSLTGTNPDNLTEGDPLQPALAYFTEVSHQVDGRSCCFGGGYYRRGKIRSALVKTAAGYRETGAREPEMDAIDYHLELPAPFPPGSPVCMAFRTQIFVTRSRVALAEGLSGNRPALVGVWDSQGRPLGGGSL